MGILPLVVNSMKDATATIGTLLTENMERDAIHVAVIQAKSSRWLSPGEPVTLEDGYAYPCKRGEGIGIVDPFLTQKVKREERCWILLYPRTITSLRHVWTHPDIPEEENWKTTEKKEASEKWMRDFCDRTDCPDYEDLLEILKGEARNWTGYGASSIEEWGFVIRGGYAHGEIPPEFWDHAEVLTGKKFSIRPEYFTCSC